MKDTGCRQEESWRLSDKKQKDLTADSPNHPLTHTSTRRYIYIYRLMSGIPMQAEERGVALRTRKTDKTVTRSRLLRIYEKG